MSDEDKPLEHADNPWAPVGAVLPPIGSSPEERDRAIARYQRDIRPGLAAGNPSLPQRPSVEAEKAAAEAKVAAWLETPALSTVVNVGYHLGQKLKAYARENRNAPHDPR
jgi:hypothetical protein